MGKSKKENKRNNVFSILRILGKKGQAPAGGGVKRAGIGQEWVTCDECRGTGKVTGQEYQSSQGFGSIIMERCKKCGGRGKIIDDKSWMRNTKKVGKAANVAGGVAKAAGGAAKGFMGSLSSAGGGGGGANLKKIGMFLLIGIVAIFIVLWFLSVGGAQSALPSAQYGFSAGIEKLKSSYAIRNFANMIQNPFGVSPTGGDFEDTAPSTPAAQPNQAFSVEIRSVTESAIFDHESIIAIVKINNLGSSRIQLANLELGLAPPFENCLKYPVGEENNSRIIRDIPPFASKEVVFSSRYIGGVCIWEGMKQRELTPNTNVGGVAVTATVNTYYATASRLAVERIKTDYGVLLIRNNLLRQQKTGAIYRAGTAMTVDLDVGHQPILDSVDQVGLLLRWVNVGSGKMSKNDSYPYVFIITPKSFGKCIPSGYLETSDSCPPTDKCVNCDIPLKSSGWCNSDNVFYTTYINNYAGDVNSTFVWACNQHNRDFHVCATNAVTEEYNIFSCALKTSGTIETNDNRVTDYITVLALYPYQVQDSKLINTFCLKDGLGECPTYVKE